MFALFFRQWNKRQNCRVYHHRGATPHTTIFSLRVLPWIYTSLWLLTWTVKVAIYFSVPLQINYVMQITAPFTSPRSCDIYLQKLTWYRSFLFLLERSMIMVSTLHSGIISFLPCLYWLASKLVSWLTTCTSFSMLLLSVVLFWKKISVSLCWCSYDSSS